MRGHAYFNEKTEIVMKKVESFLAGVEAGMMGGLVRPSSSSKITGEDAKGVACAWSTTPILSCPGSTPCCQERCYGCAGNFRFPAVKTAQYRNFMVFSEMLNAGKEEELIEGLVAMVKASPAYYAGQFRLFEVGDFYNQQVVEVWAEVAKRMPETKFWAYTRSFHLDFSSMFSLDNVKMWASSDRDNAEQARAYADLHGIQVAHSLDQGITEPVEGSIVCPQQTGKVASCWECKLCFTASFSKDVSFIYH